MEKKDEEDLQLEFSPGFWRTIAERRRDAPSFPLKDVMDELEKQERLLPEQKASAPLNEVAKP